MIDNEEITYEYWALNGESLVYRPSDDFSGPRVFSFLMTESEAEKYFKSLNIRKYGKTGRAFNPKTGLFFNYEY